MLRNPRLEHTSIDPDRNVLRFMELTARSVRPAAPATRDFPTLVADDSQRPPIIRDGDYGHTGRALVISIAEHVGRFFTTNASDHTHRLPPSQHCVCAMPDTSYDAAGLQLGTRVCGCAKRYSGPVRGPHRHWSLRRHSHTLWIATINGAGQLRGTQTLPMLSVCRILGDRSSPTLMLEGCGADSSTPGLNESQ